MASLAMASFPNSANSSSRSANIDNPVVQIYRKSTPLSSVLPTVLTITLPPADPLSEQLCKEIISKSELFTGVGGTMYGSIEELGKCRVIFRESSLKSPFVFSVFVFFFFV